MNDKIPKKILFMWDSTGPRKRWTVCHLVEEKTTYEGLKYQASYISTRQGTFFISFGMSPKEARDNLKVQIERYEHKVL